MKRQLLRLLRTISIGRSGRQTMVQSLKKMSFISMPDECKEWYRTHCKINIDVQACCIGIYDVKQVLSGKMITRELMNTYSRAGFSVICREAARLGHKECLQMAYEMGVQWDKSCTQAAAASGNIECLQFAHENGCVWNEDTCKAAAAAGHLECLKYAWENGCPWDEKTCAAATRYGHVDCLRFAHENGCRWDRQTVLNALIYDQRECLLYSMSQGHR